MNNKNLNGHSIAEETFNWIIKNVPKGNTILELGSGKGTIELSKNYKVFSIEHDKRWINVCKNNTYIHAPLKKYELYTWYNIEMIKKNLPKHYDFLLIDGPPGYTCGRKGLLYNIHLFKPDVTFLFDDVHRKNDLDNMKDIATKLNRKYEVFRADKRRQFGILYI